MTRKKKYYVVWVGTESAICTSWEKCKELTNGVSGAKYKGYYGLREAEQAFEDGHEKHWGRK